MRSETVESDPCPRTTSELLASWARRTPDGAALVQREVALSYHELSRQCDQAASDLAEQGIVPGDRVVVIGHNSIEWVVAYLATLRLGAIICPANNRLNVSQFVEQCDLLDASLVLFDRDHAEARGRLRASGHRPRRAGSAR